MCGWDRLRAFISSYCEVTGYSRPNSLAKNILAELIFNITDFFRFLIQPSILGGIFKQMTLLSLTLIERRLIFIHFLKKYGIDYRVHTLFRENLVKALEC